MGGSAPKPPDPEKTASAQFDYSTGAGIASGIINNPNIVNPYGKVSYTQAGMETITLPNGQQVQVPRYTQTTTPNKAAQQQIDSRNAMIKQMMGSTSKTLAQDPTKGAPKWQTGYDVGKLKTDFSAGGPSIGFMDINTGQERYTGSPELRWDSGDLQKDYAPADGFSEDRRRVEEATMARGSELLGQNRDAEIARLAAMGLAPGSEKYGRVSDQFERSANDLALQSVLAGGQEQSRMLGEARAAGEFRNQAVGQGYGMDMGEAEFERGTVAQNNQARAAQAAMQTAQREMENARRAGDTARYNAAKEAYNNATIAQTQMNAGKAGFNNQTRQAMIQEMSGLGSTRLNQLMALLGGTQFQNPNAPSYQGQGVQAPDYAGLVQSNYGQQVGAYNNQMQAIAGIGKSLIGAFPF